MSPTAGAWRAIPISMGSRMATGQSGYIMLEKCSHYESNTPAFRASYPHLFLDFVRKKTALLLSSKVRTPTMAEGGIIKPQ